MNVTVTLKLTVPAGTNIAGLRQSVNQTLLRSVEGISIHSAEYSVARKPGVKSALPAHTRTHIAELAETGMSERAIAAQLGLSRGTISRVLKAS